MNYSLTTLKDDRWNEMYAKQSCKKCHGTGRVGTMKGNNRTVACSCLRILAEGAKE